MSKQQDQAARFMADNIRPPDRRGTPEFLEAIRFTLPGSLRSERFRLAISPWLEFPMRLSDDPTVRRLTVIGAVQTSKSTLGEAVIVKKQATDPGNMLYNWEDDEKAEEIWNERIEKTIRDCPALKYRMPGEKTRQRKREIQFQDGMYLRMQGARAKGNRQSKSVRYLINEEVKDWEPGALTDMRNRVTAAWNSFELNISPGGILGDELDALWKDSSQHVLHFVCQSCGRKQIPRFRVEKDAPGGLHLCDPNDPEALAACKPKGGGYDYREIQKRLYYECESEGCGHRWTDTPAERETLAQTAEYVSLNPIAMPTDKGVKWSALVCPWIPWVQLIKEFHASLLAARYGDLSLLIDFVQKREANFWDPQRDDSEGEELELAAEIRKSRDGMPDKLYRIMTADKQRGEARKGETPHYWVIVRDWKPGKSTLVWEGRIDTDEDLEQLREELDVKSVFVWVDSGDGMTMIDVYRMCAKYGYVAVKGEDKSGYYHSDPKTGKSFRRYSPDQNAVVTLEDGRQVHVPLVLYSKQGIRDLLHYMRTASDFAFETPGDVSEDYLKHNKAEKLVDWVTPRTGQTIKIWKQFQKRNDLFVCECYQALVADILGIVGAVPLEDRGTVRTKEESRRG